MQTLSSIINIGETELGAISPLLIVAMVIGLIMAIAVIIINLRVVLDIAPYAYTNAKIRSMHGMLLGKKRLEELADLEPINIAGALEETEYGDIIARGFSDDIDPLKIEFSIRENLYKSYEKISGFLPGGSKKFFSIYMKKFEVADIKTVLVGIYSKTPPQEIKKHLVSYYQEELQDVVSSSTIPEAVSKLEKTEYGPILQEHLPIYGKTSSLLPLEIALDRYVYRQIQAVITTIRESDMEIIRKMIGAEVDIQNLKIILRAMVEKKKWDVSEYVIPYGYELPDFKLKELTEIDEVERIVNELEGTSYYKPLYAALEEYKEYKSIGVFEKALNKSYVTLGKSISTRQPFGVGPVIGYVISRSQEIQNIITIIKLKAENYPASEIKRLII